MAADLSGLRDPVCVFPQAIMANILSFLSPSDVAGRCGLVNKAWAAAVADPCVWEIFCRGTAVTDSYVAACPGGWREVFVRLYGTNLVRCPKFEDLNAREDDGALPVWNQSGLLEVESPPNGCSPFPGYVPGDCVIATSYNRGSVSQVIDLRHLPASFLESGPPLLVSAWYCRRFACEAFFELAVELYDSSGNATESYSSGVLRVRLDTWTRAEYLLEDYPRGLASLKVAVSGKDSGGWAGHLGSKFGPVRVRFVSPHEGSSTARRVPLMLDLQAAGGGNEALWGSTTLRRRPWFGLNDAAEVNQQGLFSVLNPLAGMDLRD